MLKAIHYLSFCFVLCEILKSHFWKIGRQALVVVPVVWDSLLGFITYHAKELHIAVAAVSASKQT